MDFQDFINCIPKIATETLLAEMAHKKMCPPERLDIIKNRNIDKYNPRKAGVMMLLYPKSQQTHLVLIIRNSYPGVHSSQIAFPGGKVEIEDASIAHTALRETHEEIGVLSDKISIIRQFTKVYIPPSNFLVYPFLGYATQELMFVPDSSEVAGIIEFPLQDFLNDNIIVNKIMATSYATEIVVPAFKINEHYVWGATAMMMSELKEVLKRVL